MDSIHGGGAAVEPVMINYPPQDASRQFYAVLLLVMVGLVTGHGASAEGNQFAAGLGIALGGTGSVVLLMGFWQPSRAAPIAIEDRWRRERSAPEGEAAEVLGGAVVEELSWSAPWISPSWRAMRELWNGEASNTAWKEGAGDDEI